MIRTVQERIRWRAVILGWAAAILTGIAFNLIFRAAHRWLFDGGSLSLADVTALVTISLISGFLAHSVGGYVTGRRARTWGGFNGAMVAVLGTAAAVAAVAVVAAIALATAGAVFSGDLSLPPSIGGLLVAVFALFLFNLLGGYLGGKLGELEIGLVRRPRETPPGGTDTSLEEER